LNVLFKLHANYRLTTVLPDATESVATPGVSQKAITSGAINSNFFGPSKSNQISPISGWGYVSGDTLADGTIIHEYIKPDFAVRTGGDATSPTVPTVAGSFAVLLSKDPNYLNDIEAAKRDFFQNHVYPLPGCPNKTHGGGVLFMNWREGWHEPSVSSPTDVFFYSNPTSLKHGYLKIGMYNFSPTISFVDAYIYTVTGEFVKSFFMTDLRNENDKMFFRWDLKNQDGNKVAPGVYFLIVHTNEGNHKRKFAITK
jgi:hypothetical protein